MHPALLAATALLAIGACSKQPTDYEAEVKDEGGGQLIFRDATPTSVLVSLPDTPMTNVPPSDAGSEAPAAQ